MKRHMYKVVTLLIHSMKVLIVFLELLISYNIKQIIILDYTLITLLPLCIMNYLLPT